MLEVQASKIFFLTDGLSNLVLIKDNFPKIIFKLNFLENFSLSEITKIQNKSRPFKNSRIDWLSNLKLKCIEISLVLQFSVSYFDIVNLYLYQWH